MSKLTILNYVDLSFEELAKKRFYARKYVKDLSQAVCYCGKTFLTNSYEAVKGKTSSCGCARVRKATKHGLHKTSLYRRWQSIHSRCHNKKDISYKNYGARGLEVCEERVNKETGFNAFSKWALENGYKKLLTLDRIDVNKGYSPENCRWVDWYTQANNKRNNRIVIINGKELTLAQAIRQFNVKGLPERTIRGRLQRGWEIERALDTPTRYSEDDGSL